MQDLGFTPARGKGPLIEIRRVVQASVDEGWRKPPIRWLMLSAPFTTGVGIYAFYALQPYLLELYGNKSAYGVAGLAAAIVAGAQIAGGLLVPFIARVFRRRTTVLLWGTLASAVLLALIGLLPHFWIVIVCLVLWSLMFAAVTPVRQAYLNGLIASRERATVLSFDNLLGSSGGVVAQPALGKAADVWGYPFSYAACAAIQVLALPFLLVARRGRTKADTISEEDEVSEREGEK